MYKITFVEISSGVYKIESSDSPRFVEGDFITNVEVVEALNHDKMEVVIVNDKGSICYP